jgi:hypothetical protein
LVAKSAAVVRFERGEAKRAAVEASLRNGDTVEAALELAGMSKASYQKYRSQYAEWSARWDRAKLVGRSVRGEDFTAADMDGPLHVPALFSDFIGKFFPDRDEPLTQHLLLAETLTGLRPREVVLFLLWPGAGKSSVIEDYICKTLAMDPDHRFRVVSSNADHAKRMLDMCKRRLTDTETYPEFIARFGPFYTKNQERAGKPWSANEFTVWKSSGGERDRSMKASGWEAATLGSRIDTLIWDDVQTPENYGEVDKIFYRLRSTYFSREKSMRTIIVGNRVGPNDLYDQLADAGLITRRVEIPAAGALGVDSGAPSVPEWWHDPALIHERGGPCCGGENPWRACPNNRKPFSPQEFLDMTKHAVGPQAWHSLYQQDPIHNSLSTFGEALEGCLDPSRRAGELVTVA